LKKIRRFFRKKFFFFYKIKFDNYKGISFIPSSNLKLSRLRFLKVVSDLKLTVLRSGEGRNLKLMRNLDSKKFLNKYKNLRLGSLMDLKKFSKKSRKLKRALSIKTIKNFLKFLEEIKDLWKKVYVTFNKFRIFGGHFKIFTKYLAIKEVIYIKIYINFNIKEKTVATALKENFGFFRNWGLFLGKGILRQFRNNYI
jgi:hypothetical protein